MFQPLTLLVAVSLAQTAFSMPALPTGQRDIVALQKRDVTNLPTSLITCLMSDTRDGLPGDKTVSFNDFQAEDAAQQGLQSAPGTSDPNPGGYSKVFENREQFVFAGCDNAAFYEYPILTTGVYGGGSPGPFRVIFAPDNNDFSSRNGKFCGIVYHPRNDDGSESGSFDLC